MRIIAGAWRGRRLLAPPGVATRPTAGRMRQAIFDMLMHAPWGGPALLEGASVLDAFAGTGAMGLEALSRGAAHATFFDRDALALSALRANALTCMAGDRARILAADALHPPAGSGQQLVFLDPPYGCHLLTATRTALTRAGWIVPGTVVIAESSRLETISDDVRLAHKMHGAAQVNVWREP